jgi:hypothetical protein
LFCKQITDEDKITKEDTDILLSDETRNFFVEFWNYTEIFDENDNSRMLALQYISTLVTTFLEPDYFHRNSKTNKYIADFNNEFPKYEIVIEKFRGVLNFIKSLDFEKGSYWFKKPNLFSLIIELSRVDIKTINISNFKQLLIELEERSNKYFAKINLEGIPEDDKLYFEYAKQGINDKKQRLHRAQVIEKLILESSETIN